MGVIFYFSSIPGLRYSKSATAEIILRKGAHFVEFAVLFFLLWRIFFGAHKFKIKKAYWVALILAIFFGASDEFHQTLVSGRSGKLIDFVFDSLSIIFSAEIILILTRWKIKWKNVLVLFFLAIALISLEIKMIKDGSSDEEKRISVILKNEANKIGEDFKSRFFEKENKIIESKAESIEEENIPEEQEEDKSQEISEKETIPKKINLAVPFISQAPFAVWDETHKEACEEASIIMLKYYLAGKKLTKEIAEKEIQELVDFQNKNYGNFKDTTAQETADLFLDFYGEIGGGKKLKVIYNFEKEDLKKYLARGYPIIVPAAGRKLGNPNFTGLGPLYHNLVLVGYDGDVIITNDPGTRKGEGYKYDIDILYDAIHDFPGRPEDIEQGRKAMIVVE